MNLYQGKYIISKSKATSCHGWSNIYSLLKYIAYKTKKNYTSQFFPKKRSKKSDI